MKKMTILSLLFAYCISIAFSQSSDQIKMIKHSFYVNDKKLNHEELKSLLLSQPESAAEYKKSRTSAIIGIGAVIVGAGFGIYGGVKNISSSVKDINSTSNGHNETSISSEYLIPTLIGAGCEIVGIALLISSANQNKRSITIYNSKHSTGYNLNGKLELGLSMNGVGIVYHF